MSPALSFKREPGPQEGTTDGADGVLLNSPGDHEGLGLWGIGAFSTWLALYKCKEEQV